MAGEFWSEFAKETLGVHGLKRLWIPLNAGIVIDFFGFSFGDYFGRLISGSFTGLILGTYARGRQPVAYRGG